ncbi:MAG: glycosyltransferase [Oscillospiraceae bacterium]
MDISQDGIKVSVIVLTYNHRKFIKAALDSILMQEVDFKYEILVGDDASNDDTQSILLKYKEQYPEIIKLHLREKNLGTTKNAYDLLQRAKGEYIAACEGDDYWLTSDKLQKQVDFLDSHQEYIGCSHKCRIVDENGIPLPKQRLSWVVNKQIYTLRDFKGLYLPGQAATILRRNIYIQPKYDYSIFERAHPFIGDRTTMMIYAAQGDFYCFPDVMSCYRRRTDKNSSGLTALVFTNSIDGVIRDFQYTVCLEEYANNTLHIDAGFRHHKRNLLTSAAFYWLLGEHSRGGKLIREILKSEKHGWTMFLYLPVGVIKKIYAKLVY